MMRRVSCCGINRKAALARFCAKLSVKSLEAGTMPSTPATIQEHDISDLIDRVTSEKDRVIVVRDGKEVAALVPLEDLETLEELDDLLEQAEADAALKEAQEKGTITLEEVKAGLGL